MRQRTLWWTALLTVLTGLFAAAPAANLDNGFLDIPWRADLRH